VDTTANPKNINKINLSSPLELYQSQVQEAFVDYNGHMNESRYLQLFSEATDVFLQFIGMDAAYLAAGCSFYTVETHLRHLNEVKQGAALKITTQLLGYDEKRLQLAHEMYRISDNQLLATAEQMLLHVDSQKSAACPIKSVVQNKLARLWAEQKRLNKPDYAGQPIRQLSR